VDPLSVLALLLVVVGWVVLNAQTKGLERRKEARASADRAKAMAAGVAVSAIEYRQTRDRVSAIKIKMHLELIELELEVFPFLSVRDGPLMGWLVAFQDATTGGSFESESFDEGEAGQDFVAAVHQALAGLTAEIERQFRANFT
jgi:hypothetical protein